MAPRSFCASRLSLGREDRRADRLSADLMNALCDRLDRAWREMRVECDDCPRDWGSVEVREGKERVDRRLRYWIVVASVASSCCSFSWPVAAFFVVKCGDSNSYSESSMTGRKV